MTTFHEHIRNVLAEVDKFIDSLKGEKLAKKVLANKDKVIEVIKKLREEWPALENPASTSDLKVPPSNDRDVSNESIQTRGSHGSGNADDDDNAYGDNVPDKAAKDLTNALKTGFLEKRRKKATLLQALYQRRFCGIQDKIFYYYEKNKDTKQSGAFYLEGYEFREAPNLEKLGNKKDLSFEIVAPGKRTYQGVDYQNSSEERSFAFLAESKEEFQAWRDAFVRAGCSTGHYAAGKPGYMSMQRQENYAEHRYEGASAVGTDEYYLQPVNPPGYENQSAATPNYDRSAGARRDSIYDDVMTPPLPSGPPPELNKKDPTPPKLPPPRRVPLKLTVNPDEDYENMYYGKWDHKAEADTELGFKYGDIIHVINQDHHKSGWWVGRLKDKYGWVHNRFLVRAYVEVKGK